MSEELLSFYYGEFDIDALDVDKLHETNEL